MDARELIVVGGPNGAGKTTFAEEYVAVNGGNYISADAIASQLLKDNPTSAQITTGREFLRRIREAITSDTHVIVESTLSGRSFRHVLGDAKQAGFTITIFYLFLDSSETCFARVQERAQKGGHFVPEADVRRRFGRSIVNFWHVYRPLSNFWTLIYNTSNQAQNIATGAGAEARIRHVELFTRFEQIRDTQHNYGNF